MSAVAFDTVLHPLLLWLDVYCYVQQNHIKASRLMCMLSVCRKVTGSLKYFHDKYNAKTHNAAHQEYVGQFDEAVQYNEQIRPHVTKVLNPDISA